MPSTAAIMEVVSGSSSGRAASELAVEPGDRISVAGRYVRSEGGDWLDMAQSVAFNIRAASWKSPRSVRLDGIDATAVPARSDADRSFIAGRMRVVGVWLGELLRVESQEPVRFPPRPRPPLPPLLALPPPPGGWDATAQSDSVHGIEQLRASGAIVRDGWLRHHRNGGGGALLLQVAASDVTAVESALAPQLPRRLCVVRSRYSADQLREVEQMFDAHNRRWGFETWSHENLDARCQPYAHARLTRVSRELADWADTLPDGLLTLRPAMTPA